MRSTLCALAVASLSVLGACSETSPDTVIGPEGSVDPSFGIGVVGGDRFVGHLEGRQEVPPVDTRATGEMLLAAAEGVETTLEYRLVVANLEDAVQAHIHLGNRGANGPVVAFLFGPVAGGVDVNGILAEGTVTEADLIPRPAISFGGTMNELLDRIRAGNAYVNVHTVAHPPGEIRGQLRAIGTAR